LFEANGGNAFDDLGPKRPRPALRDFDELLRNGRGAGNDSAMGETDERCATRRQPIDSMVGVKPLVFRGEDRIDDVARNFCERQLVTEPLSDARFPKRNPVSIEERNALDRRAK
jgi:hypothetical protein